MICNNCGYANENDNKYCGKCGKPLGNSSPNEMKEVVNKVLEDKKNIMYLSYIWLFWAVGLFKFKDDKDVKFHVGQGMVISVLHLILIIISNIIKGVIISKTYVSEATLFGMKTGIKTISKTGMFLIDFVNWTVWVPIILLSIIGIMNVNKNQKKPLPIIGKFAFYK